MRWVKELLAKDSSGPGASTADPNAKRLTALRGINNFSGRVSRIGTAARSSRSTAKNQADRDRNRDSAVAAQKSRSAIGCQRGRSGGPKAKEPTRRNGSQETRARCGDACRDDRAAQDPAISNTQGGRVPGNRPRDRALR